MSELAISETLQQLLRLCQHPYAKVAFALAKVAKGFIDGDPIQSATLIMGNVHMHSAIDAMEELEELEKKDGISKDRIADATNAILVHLRDAYNAYLSYYRQISQSPHRLLPDLWCFRQIRMNLRGAEAVQIKIAQICCLLASYHKSLGNGTAIVRKWLCEKAFPCDNYEIIAELLGPDAAMEYIAANPVIGARIAGQYLSQKGVSLADYTNSHSDSCDSEGISFGMEDPVFVD